MDDKIHDISSKPTFCLSYFTFETESCYVAHAGLELIILTPQPLEWLGSRYPLPVVSISLRPNTHWLMLLNYPEREKTKLWNLQWALQSLRTFTESLFRDHRSWFETQKNLKIGSGRWKKKREACQAGLEREEQAGLVISDAQEVNRNPKESYL